MKSYDAVMAYVGHTIPQFNDAKLTKVAQQLIGYVVQTLPTDWLAHELPSEQPHYQALAKLIADNDWQDAAINAELLALDDIMWAMGDAYPHNTGDYPLQLMVLLDYYLQLDKTDNITASDENVSTMIMLIDEYLGFYEKLVEQQSSTPINIDHWLTYPEIDKAFDQLQTIIEQTESN